MLDTLHPTDARLIYIMLGMMLENETKDYIWPNLICKAAQLACTGDMDIITTILIGLLGEAGALKRAARGNFKGVASGIAPLDMVIAILKKSEFSKVDLGHAMVAAADSGQADVVSYLLGLENGPSANFARSVLSLIDEGSALVAAATNGYVDIVVMLLECKKEPRVSANCQSGRAFMYAAKNGHMDVVTTLLNCPYNPPETDCNYGAAISGSARNGHIDMVFFLLGWKGRYAYTPYILKQVLHGAAEEGRFDMVKRILDEFDNYEFNRFDALYAAACNGHIQIVKLLYKSKGVLKDRCYGHLLSSAASCGHLEIVNLLLNVKDIPIDERNYDGAFIIAAYEGQLQIVRRFLDHTEVMRFLLEWKDHAPHAHDRIGTALEIAKSHEWDDMIKILEGLCPHPSHG